MEWGNQLRLLSTKENMESYVIEGNLFLVMCNTAFWCGKTNEPNTPLVKYSIPEKVDYSDLPELLEK